MAMPHQDPGTSTNSPNLPIFGHTHPRTRPAQFMYMYTISTHKHMLPLPLSHLSGHPLQIPHSVPLQETARSTSPNPPGTPLSATIHYCSPLLSTLISLFNQKKTYHIQLLCLLFSPPLAPSTPTLNFQSLSLLPHTSRPDVHQQSFFYIHIQYNTYS